MIKSRKAVFDNIISAIAAGTDEIATKKIILISGAFGTGKSWIVSAAENEIDTSSLSDAVLRLEQSRDMGYLPEFLNNAILTYKATYSKGRSFSSSETSYNMVRYLELLNIIKQGSPELFEDVLTSFVLKSDADIHILEGDYHSSVENKERLSKEIKNIIELKGDQRLLLETPKVVAESFIVDLMSNFYSGLMSGGDLNSILQQGSKKKIIFIIDNYEHISGSINRWLTEEFFQYCYKRKFSEFIAYSPANLPPNLKVSDLFDFRFIISSRKDPVFSHDLSEWAAFEPVSLTLRLKNIEKDEVAEFLEESGFKKEIPADKLFANSYANPYMLALWLEFYNLGVSDADSKLIYLKASESILRYNSEEQKEWIRCAAFLNEFEENGLRCFPIIGDNYKIAFSFFEKSNELAQPAKDNTKRLALNQTLREIISETVSLDSFATAKEYVSIARVYNDIKDLFIGLSSEEVNVARNLAYFNHIDDSYGLEKAFQSDAQKAKQFISKFSGWFDKSKYTVSLKPEIAAKLAKFNRFVDKDKQIDKMNLIGRIWEDYEKKLRKEIIEAQESLTGINQEIISAEKENNQQKVIYDSYQKEYIEKENMLIELRKKIGFFSSRQSFASSAGYLFTAVVIYFFGSLFPDLVGTTENADSVEIGQYVIWFIALVFLVVSFSKALSGTKIFAKRSELKELKERIAAADAEKNELQNKMKIVRDEKELVQKNINDVYERLKNTNIKIKENQEKLGESFIRN